jgi:hypothetical protein
MSMLHQDEFDWLCIELDECIAQAQALKLGHAVLLMRMAMMEVVDRAAEREAASVHLVS